MSYFSMAMRYVSSIVLYCISFFFPRDNNLWVFTSDSKGSFYDNSKYVFEYVNHNTDRTAVWLTSESRTYEELQNNEMQVYYTNSLKGIFVSLRSGCIITSHSNNIWRVSGNCLFVQLWHGIPLKKLGNDRRDEKKLFRRISDAIVPEPDIFISTSDEANSLFQSAYGVDSSSIAITGYPRNDQFYQRREKSDQSSYSNRPRTILYLPTLRSVGGESEGIDLTEDQLPLQKIESKLKDLEAELLIKPHPKQSLDIQSSNLDRIKLLERRTDIYSLLDNCDALITDYSSVFFDYLHTDNPILFYPYDLEKYENDRGFYYNYTELVPGEIATDSGEFVSELNGLFGKGPDNRAKREKLKNRMFRYTDGKSSKRVVARIEQAIYK